MSESPLLSAVGICRKAGKLAPGFDACCTAVGKGAPLVIVACDAAPRTLRNITEKCGTATRILRTDCTREQFASVLGKHMAVAAVTDSNFARLIEQAAGKQ